MCKQAVREGESWGLWLGPQELGTGGASRMGGSHSLVMVEVVGA